MDIDDKNLTKNGVCIVQLFWTSTRTPCLLGPSMHPTWRPLKYSLRWAPATSSTLHQRQTGANGTLQSSGARMAPECLLFHIARSESHRHTTRSQGATCRDSARAPQRSKPGRGVRGVERPGLIQGPACDPAGVQQAACTRFGTPARRPPRPPRCISLRPPGERRRHQRLISRRTGAVPLAAR